MDLPDIYIPLSVTFDVFPYQNSKNVIEMVFLLQFGLVMNQITVLI